MNTEHLRPDPVPKMVMIVLVLMAVGSGQNDPSEPAPVDSVNLARYVGTWYEISKLPNWFQRRCVSNTTATYALRDDGRISVVNRCSTDGDDEIEASGAARIVDPASNARLAVSFFNIFGWYLFWGDYWIIGLDPDYQYAVIGTPSRKYGWILSRTPTLTLNQREKVDALLRQNGYRPEAFISTAQERGG